jgi:hypothetical protein
VSLAREYQVLPDDIASINSPDSFVQFLGALLQDEDGDHLVAVVETLLIIIDVEVFDLGLFTQSQMLLKFVEWLPPGEFPVSHQMICVDLISRLIWRVPDIFHELCTLEYPTSLLALVKLAPLFPGAEDQTDVFVYDIATLCSAVDALLSHPASGEIGSVLSAMALGLIAIDDSRAKRPTLQMLTRMIEMDLPISLDDTCAENFAMMVADGRGLLWPLFRFLTTLHDPDFLREVIARGLLDVVLEGHVEERFEAADLVYHFFADITLDPNAAPTLIPRTIDFLDDAPYQTLVAIIRYLSVVFAELTTEAVRELINRGILTAVGFIIAGGQDHEMIECTLTFAGQVLAQMQRDGIILAQDERVQDLDAEIWALTGRLPPDVDEALIALHQLCVGEA